MNCSAPAVALSQCGTLNGRSEETSMVSVSFIMIPGVWPPTLPTSIADELRGSTVALFQSSVHPYSRSNIRVLRFVPSH